MLAAITAAVLLSPGQASAAPVAPLSATAFTPLTASTNALAGVYLRTGLSTTLVLDAKPSTVHNNGGTIYQWTYNGGVQQRWYVLTDDTIRPEADTGMCLDANPNTNQNGGTVYLWACNGGSQQKWTFTGTGGIKNTHSGRCLDMNPNTAYNGGTIYQWSCNGSPQQTWYYK
ncbi:hypothetical protein Aglo03_03890 [Actinokineospora globicatena]|uniref:Ricin B lectin domain-containing protein n=1 Tax=Actinokineospora globicatena TaxID=103729 RepID=A0A9W6QFN0_9PSEU|nr:hypothetical protein Aglo03_03890 [Actinokineospora globicatena]